MSRKVLAFLTCETPIPRTMIFLRQVVDVVWQLDLESGIWSIQIAPLVSDTSHNVVPLILHEVCPASTLVVSGSHVAFSRSSNDECFILRESL